MRDFFKFWKKEALSINEVPITGSRFTIIDTELTGLNQRKDSIVSIGAIKITGTKIELGGTFHKLVRPKASFKLKSVIKDIYRSRSRIIYRYDKKIHLSECYKSTIQVFCGTQNVIDSH